jgi:hypothetical protein
MAKTPSRSKAAPARGSRSPSTAAALPKNPLKSKTFAEMLSRAERDLVESSLGKKLASLSEKELRQFTSRARALHDKWRDLLRSQSRSTKTADRSKADAANARTSDKVAVIADALGRFETQLEKITSSVVKAVGRAVTGTSTATVAPAGPATKRPLKKAATKSTATTKAAAKARAQRTARAAVAEAADTSAAVTATASSRATKAKVRKAVAADPGQAIRLDAAAQRKAKTAAKEARFKFEGLSTRRNQHAAANTRRSQARRDSR